MKSSFNQDLLPLVEMCDEEGAELCANRAL